MNLTKKTIFFISGFIFSVLFFGLAGGVQAQTACPSATTPGLLLCEDFEDNSWSDSFDGTYNSENVSIVNSRALSGLYSVRMYGGYLGAALDYHIARSNNSMIYIKYYQYFPSGEWDWSGLSETGMKQFRVQPGDGWPLFMFKNNPNPTTHTYFSEGTNPAHPSGISMWRNIGSFPSSNNWHKVEIVVRWSDTNGGYSWKVDDVLIAGNENFAYDTWPPAAGSISNLRIGGGNGFPSGSSYYIDNVEIWDRLPGSSATCSNCCSSTQTCPTAFTTVGACTRCCASTCQAASTDTTAPRVTAFTITPTTLTVGASLTANYTVIDNTALSRVELWYANYNSTNCNETNRTGCVWNQLVSNNISGTSQSGTIPYTPHSIGSFMNGLHVVDAAGNIGYEPAPVRVTVNAQTQTCTNCCSTTQTCPTAFTTVGTCTRCCASTCQTASACGNGNCETGETCSSCASDCGACPGAQCQKIAPGAAIPAGYGAPYNTLSSSGEQLMNVVCNTDSAVVSIGANSTSQYIYRYGYIWRNNAWQRIDLTGSVPAYEGNWFRGNATATVSLTATELTQENNLIAYICNWTPSTSSGRAGEWKCGCRDSACTTPYWQLQRFGNY